MADDGSPDGTAVAVREAMARHPGRVCLLEREEKGGRGAAVIAAFRKGLADPRRYAYLFEMDADFSHHPRDLPRFLEKLGTCDMVIGSRYVEGGGTSEEIYMALLNFALLRRRYGTVPRRREEPRTEIP